MNVKLPKMIGPYHITRELGRGGMGVVYEAHDSTLKRKVAIKTISSELINSPGALERFQREAQAIAQINHPNIVSVFSIGVENGTHYIVLEMVESLTLEEVIKSYTYSDFHVYQMALQLFQGLRAAHSKAIIHRDIKPANILINEENNIKIVDFGIAKAFALHSDLTQNSDTYCTVSYTAPEVLLGEGHSVQSDIFSAGLICFELITRSNPFFSQNLFEAIEKVKTIDLNFCHQEKKFFNEGLLKVVAKCTSKDPKMRYGSCEEVLKDLDEIQSSKFFRTQLGWHKVHSSDLAQTKDYRFNRQEAFFVLSIASGFREKNIGGKTDQKTQKLNESKSETFRFSRLEIESAIAVYEDVSTEKIKKREFKFCLESHSRKLKSAFAAAILVILFTSGAQILNKSTSFHANSTLNRYKKGDWHLVNKKIIKNGKLYRNERRLIRVIDTFDDRNVIKTSDNFVNTHSVNPFWGLLKQESELNPREYKVIGDPEEPFPMHIGKEFYFEKISTSAKLREVVSHSCKVVSKTPFQTSVGTFETFVVTCRLEGDEEFDEIKYYSSESLGTNLYYEKKGKNKVESFEVVSFGSASQDIDLTEKVMTNEVFDIGATIEKYDWREIEVTHLQNGKVLQRNILNLTKQKSDRNTFVEVDQGGKKYVFSKLLLFDPLEISLKGKVLVENNYEHIIPPKLAKGLSFNFIQTSNLDPESRNYNCEVLNSKTQRNFGQKMLVYEVGCHNISKVSVEKIIIRLSPATGQVIEKTVDLGGGNITKYKLLAFGKYESGGKAIRNPAGSSTEPR